MSDAADLLKLLSPSTTPATGVVETVNGNTAQVATSAGLVTVLCRGAVRPRQVVRLEQGVAWPAQRPTVRLTIG